MVPALMAAMLLGCAGLDALGEAPQADPPGGEVCEPTQGLGGQGHTVVGADALGQTEGFEEAGEHGLGFGHPGGSARLTAEEHAAIAIGHRQGITVEAVTGVTLVCAIGAPHSIGGTHVADGFARMPHRSALAPLGHASVAAEHVTDGRACRPRLGPWSSAGGARMPAPWSPR
jgi:hypothetical protein